MSLITQEYTVLASQDGGRDVVIKPNSEFEPFVGSYVVTAYALVRDSKTKEVVVQLEPGQIVGGVGEMPKAIRKMAKPKRKSIPKDN